MYVSILHHIEIYRIHLSYVIATLQNIGAEIRVTKPALHEKAFFNMKKVSGGHEKGF